jgi:hypothetical protein
MPDFDDPRTPRVQLQKLRERLRLMSDEEFVKFGKMVRGLSEPRESVIPGRGSCGVEAQAPSQKLKWPDLVPRWIRTDEPGESGCG